MGDTTNALYRAHLGPAWRAPAPQAVARRLAGSTVLITGASAGIGAETARLLGASGARVLLVARRRELLETVASEVMAAGGEARSLACDLTDHGAIEQLLADLPATEDAIDVVINNAGKSIRRTLEESAGRFHDVTRTNAVNYLGPIQLLMGLLPAMRERGTGHVINVSTVSAGIPFPAFAVYTGSKAGFEGWLRSISPEIRAWGVATTSIRLPLVHTEMSQVLYGRLPGLTARAAAEVIAGAIVSRPRLLCPWWARLAAPLVDNAQGPFDRTAALLLRNR